MAARGGLVRAGLAGGLGLVIVLASACQDASGGRSDEGAADLAHIHGLGVNPADGTLFAASHHGLFRVTGKGAPEQVAGRTQDFMGFTVVGPDHFLGSGHPGPGDTEQPPNLGLIESTDAGESWRSVSLSGEVDFHAMEAKHDRVYGFDSQTGQVMVSDDQKSWDRRARQPLADIAVSPDDADTVLATTEEGVARSTDGGRTFVVPDGSPTLVFVDWPDAKRLAGVAPDGAVQVSADGGTTWSARGSVNGQPQAILAHGKSEVYVATEEAIHRSTDGGKTFEVFQQL